jgi:2-polyprenyl-3-methyl-5-hydroxy-6-metoxy-1,4-benzoquinol methylase
MKPQLLPVMQCSPNEVAQIKTRLDRFYGEVSDYSAFSEPSDQVHCWKHIAERVRQLSAIGRRIRVLELGAGRSGFGNFLASQSLRELCIWTAQDVTDQNVEWLEANADKVILGDIETAVLEDSQDIIFSTYVLEHVVNPAAHLNSLVKLINPTNGMLFVFCPRYDLPGYTTPSSKHLSKLTRLSFMLISSLARIQTLFTGRPAFLVQTDLAAFYQPFFTDADAVHWVSLFDLRAWSRTQRGMCSTLKIGNPKFPSKDFVVKRFLTVGISVAFGSK